MSEETTKPGENPRQRRRAAVAHAAEGAFDLCVIGGGITGVGIARDAALRGLSVALIEKGDLASGTSSQSSKLIHGGVRYLEQFAFGLVRESIRERDALSHNAAHLARRLPFIYPIYRGDKHGPFTINLGMWLYDAFALFRRDRRHKMLSRAELEAREPALKTEDMRGATLYYDCMTDDGRLTIETALDARERGALILTRVRARGLLREAGRVIGVEAEDLLEGQGFDLRARVTVSAAGPWTDALLGQALPEHEALLRPTKGVHIVVDHAKLPVNHAVVMRSGDDRRVLFAIPWNGRAVVGTTDTDDDQGPDACRATGADVDYLLRAARLHFPGSNLRREDVIATWAGLRPLLRAEGVDPSAVSREHEIRELAPGFLCVFGGKLTTYRLMAEQVVDRSGLAPKAGASMDTPLPGARSEAMRADPLVCGRDMAERRGLPIALGEHLALRYGDRAEEVLAMGEGAGLAAEPLKPGLPYIWPELLYAIREEGALDLEDLLRRRLLIALTDREQGLDVLPRASELMARELEWSAEERQEAEERYRAFVAETRAFREE